MPEDKLSELVQGAIREIAARIGPNEVFTATVATEKGIKIIVTRQDKVTFFQAFVAITWFPILATIITIYLWSKDRNTVVIRYAAEHLTITATGIFAAWMLATWLMIRLFRYVRQS